MRRKMLLFTSSCRCGLNYLRTSAIASSRWSRPSPKALDPLLFGWVMPIDFNWCAGIGRRQDERLSIRQRHPHSVSVIIKPLGKSLSSRHPYTTVDVHVAARCFLGRGNRTPVQLRKTPKKRAMPMEAQRHAQRAVRMPILKLGRLFLTSHSDTLSKLGHRFPPTSDGRSSR